MCGGGTGGHIYPATAALVELQNMGIKTTDMLWIGTNGQMEERLVPAFNIPLATIQGGPVVGVPVGTTIKNLAKLALSSLTANQIIAQFKPTVALFTGGYVNAPVALMNWLRRIPACIYLPDVEPGSTIRRLLPFVQKVAVTTPDSAKFLPAEKMVVTGYPVRPELRQANEMSQAEALAQFDLSSERPTLFVFGGSRGALSINRALMKILPKLLAEMQVIHISGTFTWDEVRENAGNLPATLRPCYRPFAYLDEQMGVAFRAADLVVARAGASMLGESPAFGLPAILVPYPHAWRYQKVNADYLAERGAAIRLNDEQLDEKLYPTIQQLFQNHAQLAQMREAARKLDQPKAAKQLAQLLLDMEKKQNG